MGIFFKSPHRGDSHKYPKLFLGGNKGEKFYHLSYWVHVWILYSGRFILMAESKGWGWGTNDIVITWVLCIIITGRTIYKYFSI